MKKVFVLLFLTMLSLSFVACSNNADDRTINHFLQAFEDDGFDTSNRQSSFFQMIGANDGMQFIIDGSHHTIYSFESVNTLEQAFRDHPFMETQGWVANGRFVIESNVDEINEFFRNIE